MIRTDQKSLKFLADQRILGEEQFKWTFKLLGFDFEVQYKPKVSNKAADALFRQMMYASLSGINLAEWEVWERQIAADEKLVQLLQQVILEPLDFPKFSVKNGVLFHQGSIVLPKRFSKIPMILTEFHSSPQGVIRVSSAHIRGLLEYFSEKEESEYQAIYC